MTQRIGNTKTEAKMNHIVDFNKVREYKMEKKRRHTERIFFKNLLNVYTVTGQSQMHPIELIDVSEDGCSFQMPFNPEKPWPKDVNELPIRVYFSQDTYLEILVKIQNSSPSIDNHVRYTRYGCTVDKGIKSYPAFQQFVRFLKLYSEHARKDMGDITIFYL